MPCLPTAYIPLKIFADASVFDAGRCLPYHYQRETPIRLLHLMRALSFRGRSKEFCLYAVAGSSRQQHDQGEYGGQYYNVDTNHMPPKFTIRITANNIRPAIHCSRVIMLLVSCRSALPGACICPEPSSRDPLSSAPSSGLSLSICVCSRI